MRDAIVIECLDCLNENGSLPESNKMNVVLIPKKVTPERVQDLRLIFLSNVIDWVMCKVIANRLK